MKTIKDFIITTPYFHVKLHLDMVEELVNEYTFRNLQLAVKEKKIAPFWFLNINQEWEICRKDGILRGYAYAKGFANTEDNSAMSITAMLAIKLLRS